MSMLVREIHQRYTIRGAKPCWMALSSYGVLRGRAVGRRREDASDESPHYQVHVLDEQGDEYRIAVNVLSQQAPSELLYLAVDDFRHPLTALLPSSDGWTPLPSQPGAANLDFIRGNLFDPAAMRPLPPDVAGPDNDLADRLDHYTGRAIGDADVRLYAFGAALGPRGNGAGQGLRLPARQRRARHPHEPGQQRRGSAATTASGRTAASSSTSRPKHAGWPSSWRSRARPGTPTTPPGTPSRVRSHDRRQAIGRCASSPPSSTR